MPRFDLFELYRFLLASLVCIYVTVRLVAFIWQWQGFGRGGQVRNVRTKRSSHPLPVGCQPQPQAVGAHTDHTPHPQAERSLWVAPAKPFTEHLPFPLPAVYSKGVCPRKTGAREIAPHSLSLMRTQERENVVSCRGRTSVQMSPVRGV